MVWRAWEQALLHIGSESIPASFGQCLTFWFMAFPPRADKDPAYRPGQDWLQVD